MESIRVGRLVIEDDPKCVRERDDTLRQAQKSSTKQLVGYRIPGLSAGFIAREGASRGAGEVFVQGRVTDVSGTRGRFDDVMGRGYLIIARAGDPVAALSTEQRAYWRSLGGRILTFGNASSHEADGHFSDDGGWYGHFMNEFGANVIVKRPDYHVFGTYQSVEHLPRALEEMRVQLEDSTSSATSA
jgi:hypothetical protein